MEVPTVTVCTDKFASFAREKAIALKAVGLPLVPVPHPITGRRLEEVAMLVSEAFPKVVSALTMEPKWDPLEASVESLLVVNCENECNP